MPGMSDRLTKRRGPLLWLADRSRRFWIITAALPFVYVALFGAACWVNRRTGTGSRVLGVAYLPIGMAFWYTPLRKPIADYASFGTGDDVDLIAWSRDDGAIWAGPLQLFRDLLD